MKAREVVLERGDGAPQSPMESADLRRALHDTLERDGYLTAAEAALYTRRPSLVAFYCWRRRHRVRTYRAGSHGTLLFKKRDLDEVLQPTSDRVHRRHFASIRGGR